MLLLKYSMARPKSSSSDMLSVCAPIWLTPANTSAMAMTIFLTKLLIYFKEFKEFREFKEFKEFKEFREFREFKEFKEFKEAEFSVEGRVP